MEAAILIIVVSSFIAVAILAWRRRTRGVVDSVVYQGAIKAIRDGHFPALERFVPYLPSSARPELTVSPSAEDTIPLVLSETPEARHPDAPSEGGPP